MHNPEGSKLCLRCGSPLVELDLIQENIDKLYDSVIAYHKKEIVRFEKIKTLSDVIESLKRVSDNEMKSTIAELIVNWNRT